MAYVLDVSLTFISRLISLDENILGFGCACKKQD